MLSLFTFTTEPGPCGYLPDRDWSLNYEVVGELTPLEYQERLKEGWRRFGYSLFRPACPSCRMCLSIRVPVATFRPDRSQRRALAANCDVDVVVGRPEATREKLNLYDRFHEYQHATRGWPHDGPASAADYVESFVDHPFPTEEWRYLRDGRLIGVGYVDALPEALSAIYFYYDPKVRDSSPGTYNVLAILRAAAAAESRTSISAITSRVAGRSNTRRDSGRMRCSVRMAVAAVPRLTAQVQNALLVARPPPPRETPGRSVPRRVAPLPRVERPLYAALSERDRARLRDDLRVLVAEKNWEGCGGLEMTDEIKVTIAAQAAILLLGIEHDYFARVQSILVYPTGFRSPEGWTRPDGVIDLSVGALGQAWYDGPVVLAWDSVLEGGRDPRDGLNVVLHEFAHQLDYLDGLADGTPLLRRKGDYARWQEVMTREFERLKAEAGSGTARVLDAYGATDHAEFFAVATEAFFEKPREMCSRHPELYAVLCDYYGQDPAARSRPEGPSPPEHGDRRPVRSSRKAARVEQHASVARDWPGWVQFWDLHPGVSRAQALRPLNDQASYAIRLPRCRRRGILPESPVLVLVRRLGHLAGALPADARAGGMAAAGRALGGPPRNPGAANKPICPICAAGLRQIAPRPH